MGECLAPVDEYGMPYAIYPSETISGHVGDREDEDHAFYQGAAVELQDPAGQALRMSRVHDVARWLHDRKHHFFRDGLEVLPTREQDKYGLLVLSCAGYLSRMAWDLSKKNKAKLVEMDDPIYLHVRSRSNMHFQTNCNSRIPPNGPNPRRTQDHAKREIGLFLTDYAKRQDLAHIKDRDFVDEFLSISDEQRRFKLARIILEEATHVAVEPISPIYQRALADGLLRLSTPDPASTVIRYSFVGPWREHVHDLELKLAS